MNKKARAVICVMDERLIRKYFLRAFALRFLEMLLVGLFIIGGLSYLFLYMPTFFYNNYLQVLYITAIMTLAFIVSTAIVAPLTYRLDREFQRTTLRFGGYLSYKLRSRIVFLIPLLVLLGAFTFLYFFVPSTDELSTLLTFAITILVILVIGLGMPKIYGSMLKKQEIGNPELLESIKKLFNKMDIRSQAGGAYHVPVQGFKVANAAQLGFARKQRRIYLIGDIENVLTKGELDAVIAHEFAHMKLRHILKLTLALLALMVGAYVVSAFLGIMVLYFFSYVPGEVSVDVLVTSIIILDYIAPLVLVYLLLFIIRRTYEYEADQLAARSTSPQDLSSALLKLAEYNLIPMKFPRAIGVLMPHPSMTARLERLKRLQQTR